MPNIVKKGDITEIDGVVRFEETVPLKRPNPAYVEGQDPPDHAIETYTEHRVYRLEDPTPEEAEARGNTAPFWRLHGAAPTAEDAMTAALALLEG